MLISFIVPAYNIPEWMLRECIDSILAQPLRADEREIIVVDDGSDEPVPPMDGVTLIRQPNGGLSAARNAALDVACGEWVEMVDSDDCLLPAWSGLVPMLKDKRLDVIRMGVERDSGQVRRTTAAQHLMNDNMQAAVCRYVIRRSVIDDLRFTPGILHEDEEFTPLMLSRAGGLLLFGRRCYCYRQREDSIMHRPDAAHIARRLSDAEGVIIRLYERNLPVLRRRIAQLTMDYVYNSLRLERSLSATRSRIRRLREHGLWPLPRLAATMKYAAFRLVGRLL